MRLVKSVSSDLVLPLGWVFQTPPYSLCCLPWLVVLLMDFHSLLYLCCKFLVICGCVWTEDWNWLMGLLRYGLVGRWALGGSTSTVVAVLVAAMVAAVFLVFYFLWFKLWVGLVLSAKTNLNVEQVFFSIARDIKQRLADTDTRAEGSSKAGNRDWISRFMVFTSGVCWIAGSWSPELASKAARELSS
ncbi:hypothetical protein DVH24_021344 [Malus domestica]|uniref:Uncharacterized protein n=1 Tax=Malus domestica TaxID=3750 RepID=A0A498K1F7_MALDO|nr:hypothetical protein DVH24_021344 [Malus domestica]